MISSNQYKSLSRRIMKYTSINFLYYEGVVGPFIIHFNTNQYNIKQIHICIMNYEKNNQQKEKHAAEWQNCKLIFYNQLHQLLFILNRYTHQFKNAEHIKICLSIYMSVLSIRKLFLSTGHYIKLTRKTCIIMVDFELGVFDGCFLSRPHDR